MAKEGKEEMISVENFARRVGIGRSYAYQLASQGKIESSILGDKRIIRVPASEVERYQASRRRENVEFAAVG